MSSNHRRRSWLIPTVVALITFLGGLSGNLLTADSAAQILLMNYRGWIWAVTILAGITAVIAAYRDSRLGDDGDPARRTLAEVDSYGALERRYLEQVAQRFQYLPLRGVDFKSASAETGEQERLGMADVYIALNVVGGDREQMGDIDDGERRVRALVKQGREDPVPLLGIAAQQRRVVITGDPGGGKTTFLHHLAFCLARERLNPKQDWLARLPEWPQAEVNLLPIPIVLREVAAWFSVTQPHQRRTGLLHAYLTFWLDQMGLSEFYDLLLAHLGKGTALLMLDGLDEVPLHDEILERVKEMIDALPTTYPNCRILVTCRVLSYRDPRWQLSARPWSVVEISPLDEKQIDRFIQAWYGQLAAMQVVTPGEGQTRSDRLSQAVRRADLWRLAPNPLLLTVMALVHTHKGELPDARAALYEDVVDLLLWRWEAIKLAQPDGRETTWRQLLQAAGLSDLDVKLTLWELAFEAHSQQAGDGEKRKPTADIAKADLLRTLRTLHPDQSLDWAEQLIQIMNLRAGLLVEGTPEIYSFPHRTFQEYLAGCHLGNLADFTERALDLAAQGAYWRESILLAVGRLVHVSGDIDRPLMLVSELCPTAQPAAGDVERWRTVWLAGDCLLELGLKRAERRETGRALVLRVRGHLCSLLEQGQLTPRERAEAGSALSALGDPRDFDEMIPIPGGEFEMGGEGDEDEKPRHKVWVADFRMAKYPVTNGQYADFVAATGHPPPPHWRGSTPPPHLRTRPVVNVSWRDAQAYCSWLSQERGEAVRLPSEAEWEKAARGSDGREFPWGNTFDRNRANMRDTGIGDTSPVGIFPDGVSPYGCYDMAGNVWEWTRSLWGKDWEKPSFKYPYNPEDGREDEAAGDDVTRVVRGGSWHNSVINVRCAVRHWYGPNDRYDYYGFRVSSPGL